MLGGIQTFFSLLFVVPFAPLLASPPAVVRHLPDIPQLTDTQLRGVKAFAREQFQEAYETVQGSPEDGEACGRLGMIFQAHGLHEFAVVCYDRARLLEPGSFRWVYYLGQATSELGKASEAVSALRQAVRLEPNFPPVRLKLAESLLAARELEESGKIYKAFIEEDPSSALAHYGLGQVHSARGERRAALASYLRACQLFPAFAAAHYSLGMTYRDLGEKDRSREHLALFQHHKGTTPPLKDSFVAAIRAFHSRGDFHFAEGLRLENEGHLKEAVVEYERTIEERSHLWEAHSNLVSLYGILGELKKAEEHYHAAIKVHPHVWETHNNFGLLLRRQGRLREAADAFERALASNPFSAQAHGGLADVLEATGRLEEAARHCSLAIENDPQFRFAHFTLGRIRQRQGRHPEAIQHFRKTVAIEDASTAMFLFTLAKAYVESGDSAKAGACAEEARQRATFYGHKELADDLQEFLRRLKQ